MLLLGAPANTALGGPSPVLSRASLVACLLLASSTAVEVARVKLVLVIVALVIAIIALGCRLAPVLLERLNELLVFQEYLVRLVLVQEEESDRKQLAEDVEDE